MPTTPLTSPEQLAPSARKRAALVKRLSATTARTTTATVAEMERRHDWFRALDAEHRSWITLVARGGIDGFVTWFQGGDVSPVSIFDAAPRALMRKVSLQQTVELVRTTIEVFESTAKEALPRDDADIIEKAMLLYSREIAFAAASVYARAAEVRGAWDARLEALVVDNIVRGEADETVISRASALGWTSPDSVCVVMGLARDTDNLEDVRRLAGKLGLDCLVAPQGDRLVMVLGGEGLSDDRAACDLVAELGDVFADGPVVVGPVVDHLVDAAASARAASAGLRAAPAWPQAPRPVAANDLLPERALSGDGHARRQLARDIHDPLAAAGGDLLLTCEAFLDHYGSVEGTGRALFVHANTVRYRLKRIHDVTGYSPTDARDAFVLRMAITLGRLLPV